MLTSVVASLILTYMSITSKTCFILGLYSSDRQVNKRRQKREPQLCLIIFTQILSTITNKSNILTKRDFSNKNVSKFF